MRKKGEIRAEEGKSPFLCLPALSTYSLHSCHLTSSEQPAPFRFLHPFCGLPTPLSIPYSLSLSRQASTQKWLPLLFFLNLPCSNHSRLHLYTHKCDLVRYFPPPSFAPPSRSVSPSPSTFSDACVFSCLSVQNQPRKRDGTFLLIPCAQN